MYAFGPPGTQAGGGPLRISRVKRAMFGGNSAAARDPGLPVYLADLVRPSGLALRKDLIEDGVGQSYGDMAAAVAGEAVQENQPVDLLVLAFAVPDVSPERATATYLSHLCPGEPMAFAVCDQGAAAPFTALRVAAGYGCARTLLVIAEQTALHYEPGVPAVMPDRNAAVALLCDGTGAAGLEMVRVQAAVAPEQVAGVLGAEVGPASAGGLVLVAGHELARLAGDVLARLADASRGAGAVRVAPPGQPYTGVWWELAGGLAGWMAAGRRVMVADYDPGLRYLGLGVFGGEA